MTATGEMGLESSKFGIDNREADDKREMKYCVTAAWIWQKIISVAVTSVGMSSVSSVYPEKKTWTINWRM